MLIYATKTQSLQVSQRKTQFHNKSDLVFLRVLVPWWQIIFLSVRSYTLNSINFIPPIRILTHT
jgi:hypothetical protein